MRFLELESKNIYDFANEVRYILSYSRNEEEFFLNLMKKGIYLVSEKDIFKFKTLDWILTDKEIVELTNDDFFLKENLKKYMGYNMDSLKFELI